MTGNDQKTVLVVDDDDVFVLAITAVLKSRYHVVRASNGPECLEIISRARPDCVILDVMMDYLSEGFDVARQLRGQPSTSRLPIIMLTGVDQVYNLRMEVEESWVPADRYLEKPIEPSVLLAEIADLLQ